MLSDWNAWNIRPRNFRILENFVIFMMIVFITIYSVALLLNLEEV